MSEKTIYLPPSFDTAAYLEHRVNSAESHARVENDFAGFNQWGGPSGMSQVNPFNLPFSQNTPNGQMLSNANTIFDNLRWYFISNERQVLAEAYVELGLVQTIVDIPVDDAFRGGVEVKTKQLSPEQIEELMISLDRDDDLQTVAQTAKWNRLFGGAGTLILTDQDPRSPLDIEAIGPDTPMEFRSVDLWELFWSKNNDTGYDPEIQAEDFQYYNYYGEIIHKSRVMRMKGMTAPSFNRPRLRGWGFSVVENLVRSINQYLKSTDLAFELLDEYKIDIYKIRNLVNTLLSPQGGNKVRQRIAVTNQIKGYQGAIVMDAEDDYQQKTVNWTGFADVMKEIRMQIAADMRIPLTKLFGLSAAGFSSGQDDIEVYNAMVESSVRNKVKYQVLRVLEIKCQKMFGIIPSDLRVTFKPLRIMSGTDEETIKTSKFNRLFQAQQANQITMDQFIDACNRGQLFDLALEHVDMIGQDGADSAGEGAVIDPTDPESEKDPGTNREDTRGSKAWEVGGAPKGQEKTTKAEPPPASSEDDEDPDDEVKNPESPAGKKDTPRPKRATNPDDDDSNEEQRKPVDKAEKPTKKAEWKDEKMPEEELQDHSIELEKPKKEPKAKGDAPEGKPGKTVPKPKTADAKKPKTGDAKKPKNNERRINNAREDDKIVQERLKIGITPALKDKKTGKVYAGNWNQLHADILDSLANDDPSAYSKGFMYKGRFIFEQEANAITQKMYDEGKLTNSQRRLVNGQAGKTQAAIDARTTGDQPGIVFPRKDNDVDPVTFEIRQASTTKEFAVFEINGNYKTIVFRTMDKGEAQKKLKYFEAQEVKFQKMSRGNPGNPFSAESIKKMFKNEDSLADEADMIEHPKEAYEQPNDKALDSQKDRHKNVPTKYVAVVGVVTKDHKFILTGKRRDTSLFVCPGGKVEPGEEWVEAAVRELHEEAGIDVSVKVMQQSLLTQKSFHYPDHKTVVRAYLIELPDRVQAKTTEDPDLEVSIWKWVPLHKNTPELQSWSRHAQEDIVIQALLKPKFRGQDK